MNFFNTTYQHYCGIDLHARSLYVSLYVCILDRQGETLLHKEIPASPQALRKLIEPYLDDLVMGVECMHCWYWVADFCQEHGIAFILGHALYMRAIHGGKTKNDRIDSYKIATLMRRNISHWPTSIPTQCEQRAICCVAEPIWFVMAQI